MAGRKVVNKTERLAILRVTDEDKSDTYDIVVKELPLTIFFNNRELVTTLCSPVDLDYLTVGTLSAERLISSMDEIKKLVVDSEAGVAYVETRGGKGVTGEQLFRPLVASGGGKGASCYSVPDVREKTRVESKITISADEVFALVREFLHRSPVYLETHGVHSAALCDNHGILVFHDDIGRHNAVDKVFGECLVRGILTDDRIIITSGRISSEILLKVARRKIPILISKAAPTNLGVKLANDLGVTLIGFVRSTRMNVYSHGWRVVAGEK